MSAGKCVGFVLTALCGVALVWSGLADVSRAEDVGKRKPEPKLEPEPEVVNSVQEIAPEVLAKAKIELSKALETAQAKAPKARLIYASADADEGKPLFVAYLLAGEKVFEADIDAVTGSLLAFEEISGDELEDLTSVKKALAVSKLSLAQAIAAAKTKVKGGRPFEVGLALHEGKSIIEVALLTGKTVTSVEIDAVNGKVLEVAALK